MAFFKIYFLAVIFFVVAVAYLYCVERDVKPYSFTHSLPYENFCTGGCLSQLRPNLFLNKILCVTVLAEVLSGCRL